MQAVKHAIMVHSGTFAHLSPWRRQHKWMVEKKHETGSSQVLRSVIDSCLDKLPFYLWSVTSSSHTILELKQDIILV